MAVLISMTVLVPPHLTPAHKEEGDDFVGMAARNVES